MRHWQLALRLESVGLPFREAIEFAGRSGFTGVEFDAVGELAPLQLSQTGRREVRNLLQRHGLRLVALGFPTRHGYDFPERWEARIEATTQAMLLAFDLGAPVVVNQLGRIPPPEEKERTALFHESLSRLANEGDRVGARLALLTGSESPEALEVLLTPFSVGGLAVNFSPASLVPAGIDLQAAIARLAPWIAGAHVRDVVRSSLAASGVREVPLGEGEISWGAVLKTLTQVDGCRHLTLVQEPSPRAQAGLLHGLSQLAEWTGRTMERPT